VGVVVVAPVVSVVAGSFVVMLEPTGSVVVAVLVVVDAGGWVVVAGRLVVGAVVEGVVAVVVPVVDADVLAVLVAAVVDSLGSVVPSFVTPELAGSIWAGEPVERAVERTRRRTE